jgi:hypothetical protein
MTKKIQQTKKKEQKKEEIFTKEDFLKALKKATRPITRKVSPSKGKKKTSE